MPVHVAGQSRRDKIYQRLLRVYVGYIVPMSACMCALQVMCVLPINTTFELKMKLNVLNTREKSTRTSCRIYWSVTIAIISLLS